jgi:hypothetical protein
MPIYEVAAPQDWGTDLMRQNWPVQFTGAQGEDVKHIFALFTAKNANTGAPVRVEGDGQLTLSGSVLMLKFKSLKCQAEAGDALMKIVDTKMFGPAFTLRPLKADAVQVINWKIKKEKADAGPNQTPAPAGPAGLTKPTGPTSVSTKPQPPSMLDHPTAPGAAGGAGPGLNQASTLELELEYFGYAEKRVELTVAAAEAAKKAHERLIAGER